MADSTVEPMAAQTVVEKVLWTVEMKVVKLVD